MRADARERRTRIITTACELYRTHHHDSLTLEQIAEAADVGIATLYRNFPDRGSLDMACAVHLFEGVIALMKQTITDFDTAPLENWSRFNRALVTRGLGSLVPALAPESLDDLHPEVAALRDTTASNARTLISLARKHGLVHADIDPATYIVGLITISRPPVPALTELHTGGADLLEIYLAGLQHARPGATGPTECGNAD